MDRNQELGTLSATTLPADGKILIVGPADAHGMNIVAGLVADHNRSGTWIDFERRKKYTGTEVTPRYNLVLVLNQTDRTGVDAIRRSARGLHIPCSNLAITIGEIKQLIPALASRRQKPAPIQAVAVINGHDHTPHEETSPAVSAEPHGSIPAHSGAIALPAVTPPIDAFTVLEEFKARIEPVQLAVIQLIDENRTLREQTSRLEQEVQKQRAGGEALDKAHTENAELTSMNASLEQDNQQLQTTLAQLRERVQLLEAESKQAQTAKLTIQAERDRVQAELTAFQAAFSGVNEMLGKLVKKPS